MSSDDESEKGMNIGLKDWEPAFPVYDHKDRPEHIRKKSIKPFSMILAASRNQGKSVLIRHLYEQYWEGKFDLVIVFSKTLGNGWYDQFIKHQTKFSTFDTEKLEMLNDIQQEQLEKTGYYLNILCIFDDCLGKDIMYSQELDDIFTLGRHKGISVVFATQNPTCINQTARQNTTHAIVLRLKGRGREHIIDGWLTDLVDEDEEDMKGMKPEKWLKSVMKWVFSERYRSMVIEYDKEGSSFDSCVFTYKLNEDQLKWKRRGKQ